MARAKRLKPGKRKRVNRSPGFIGNIYDVFYGNINYVFIRNINNIINVSNKYGFIGNINFRMPVNSMHPPHSAQGHLATILSYRAAKWQKA
jgi:hypothetical protein